MDRSSGFQETEIAGLVIIQPQVFEDGRGYFFESFSQRRFEEAIGTTIGKIGRASCRERVSFCV